ncbi:MAG: NifB/NifX family molybdenum-iron cluster-binding protein [Deltaproteobacteria bacterium]|nr:NifB/NifX family molybdenum-iron cluster-binding protein [Deltaproteobacteria bacterium]
MKVAVPLLGSDVAPRFGEASHFIIAESFNGEVTAWDTLALDRIGDWVFRLSELELVGVNVALCCGFNRFYWPLAIEKGIRVITGATGDATKLVQAFVHGEKLPLLPCCASPGRHRFQIRNRCQYQQAKVPRRAEFAGRKE